MIGTQTLKMVSCSDEMRYKKDSSNTTMSPNTKLL